MAEQGAREVGLKWSSDDADQGDETAHWFPDYDRDLYSFRDPSVAETTHLKLWPGSNWVDFGFASLLSRVRKPFHHHETKKVVAWIRWLYARAEEAPWALSPVIAQ